MERTWYNFSVLKISNVTIWGETNPAKPCKRSPGNNCSAHWGKLVAAFEDQISQASLYSTASQIWWNTRSPGGLVNPDCWTHPRAPDSVDGGWDLRICLSNQHPGDAEAACLGTILWEPPLHCLWRRSSAIGRYGRRWHDAVESEQNQKMQNVFSELGTSEELSHLHKWMCTLCGGRNKPPGSLFGSIQFTYNDYVFLCGGTARCWHSTGELRGHRTCPYRNFRLNFSWRVCLFDAGQSDWNSFKTWTLKCSLAVNLRIYWKKEEQNLKGVEELLIDRLNSPTNCGKIFRTYIILLRCANMCQSLWFCDPDIFIMK